MIGKFKEITRYLRTEKYDTSFSAWEGRDFCSQARTGLTELKTALVAEVRRWTDGTPEPLLPTTDLVTLTRRKIGPMVRGLFGAGEREQVLAALERCVVFLTPVTIERVLLDADWLHTAWELANLYLGSMKAELLGPDAPRLVGLSEGTTCYVSAEYFAERDRFSDFLVHEVAHIFHNCKRRTIGLRETRTREWLLDIEFRKRETFAYACEAYGRILELAQAYSHRAELVEELAAGALPNDERVDGAEYLDIVREAAASRNGWRRILARCGRRKATMRSGERDARATGGSALGSPDLCASPRLEVPSTTSRA